MSNLLDMGDGVMFETTPNRSLNNNGNPLDDQRIFGEPRRSAMTGTAALLFLLSACEAPTAWPYAVEGEEGSFGDVARCLFGLAQTELRSDILLSAGSFWLAPDGLLEYAFYSGSFQCGLAEIAHIELMSPSEPEWWGNCSAVHNRYTGEDDLSSTLSCDVSEWVNPRGGITEWEKDSTDIVVPPGVGVPGYLLARSSVEAEWDVPDGDLDAVPEGRALYAFTDPQTSALTHVIDGVTGEILFLGAAPWHP